MRRYILSSPGRLATIAAAIAVAMVATLIMAQSAQSATPVQSPTYKFYLECPTTEVQEGESFDVFLIQTGDQPPSTTRFGAKWHTDTGTAGNADYEAQNSTDFVWGTYEESQANRIPHTFETKQDNLAEGSETFTVRFSPVDRVVDRDDPDRDEKCDITILDDDPNITDVEVTSSPEEGETYGRQETIEITATFNIAVDVDVDGNPGLGMWVGSNWRAARYLSGSGTKELVFSYPVKEEDIDVDGIKMDGGYQDNNGRWHNFIDHTAVTAADTDIVAHRIYSGIDDQSGHKVDGGTDNVDPTITSVTFPTVVRDGDVYKKDDEIVVQVVFSEDIVVTGSPQIELDIGGQARLATYERPPGLSYAHVAPFFYTVQDGDNDLDGVSIDANKLTLNGGTIDDTVENTAVLTHNSVDDNPGVPVQTDFTPPEISTVSVTSNAGDDNTYAIGDKIEVTVTFSETVQILGEGNLILKLDFDSLLIDALYDSHDGATVKFAHTVASDDSASTGLAIRQNSVKVNHPEPNADDNSDAPVRIKDAVVRTPLIDIYDLVGNPAILEHESVPADDSHKVDGIVPAIERIGITSNPGEDDTYGIGDAIQITVLFSEDVTVTGAPQLDINVGGTAKTASYSSNEGKRMVFSYTVASGDSDDDGIAIGANKLSLNGGTIRDAAGNDAAVGHLAVSADSDHKVDGSDTTAPTISSVAITSSAGDDDTYGNGDSIQVTVTFSEDVTVTGAPQLEIDVGGTAKTAAYSSTSGANVVFSYTVAVGDSDDDGVAIGANKLSLNSGTIKDGAGNAATLTHSAVSADSDHKVSAPGGL